MSILKYKNPVTGQWEKVGIPGVDITPEEIGAVTQEQLNEAIAAIPMPDVSGQINTHNADTAAHADIRTLVNGKATTAAYIATVTATWTADSDYFYQDVAVSGILATDTPIVDINPGSDNAANALYSESICKVFRITTSENSIRVWATEAVETAFPIQLKVVR